MEWINRAYLRLTTREEGQGMVEYGLIIALVAIVLVAALVTLRGGVETVFTNAATQLTK